MTDAELLSRLDWMRSVMISVSTGEPRIAEVNKDSQDAHRDVTGAIVAKKIEGPLSYASCKQEYIHRLLPVRFGPNAEANLRHARSLMLPVPIAPDDHGSGQIA